MENTKENTDLNMGRAKNDRWKKILGIILNIALLLLIDGLLVYTFINEENRIYKGTIIKILLIVTGNILFLVLLFCCWQLLELYLCLSRWSPGCQDIRIKQCQHLKAWSRCRY